MDGAVRALAAGLGTRVALVALGGYGRRTLSPGSDVDLMVLHAERRADRVREAAELVFYPFWDAGVPLGHAVRTVRQCLDQARGRVDSACSLLEARLVWGEASLADDLEARLVRTLRRDPARFLERLGAETVTRHAAFPSCATSLEPDLKDGAGGLRDIHAIGWAGRLFGEDRADLVDRALLRGREVRVLDDAEELLVRLRGALHLETGSRSDRLVLEQQPGIAAEFGFETTAALEGADALMRSVFGHARHVEHVRDLFFERAHAAAEGKPLVGDHPSSPRAPEDLMRAFADAARGSGSLSPVALDAMERADLGPAPYGWTEGSRRAFVDILGSGDPGARALEAMDRAGIMTRFLPAWEDVRCRPQRDPYHRFPVDVHLVRTAVHTAGILQGADDPTLARASDAVEDREAMLLGALFHDLGKTGAGPHVEVGVRVAGESLERMGAPDRTRSLAAFLVEHHLLLADMATRRDLSDENLILDVAARVGDPERLAMLYILTAADAEATGPHASSQWRMALVRELVAKVERALVTGDMGPDRAAILEDRTRAIRQALAAEDPSAVEAYLARLPRAYVLDEDPGTAASHFRLVHPPLGATDVRTMVQAAGRPGSYELSVVAADRPGLLAKIAGALSLAGLDIRSARAFTTEDGVAIDRFAVETAFHGEADEDRWRRFRTHLRKALEGRISLEYRVREKRRYYPAPSSGVGTEVRVLQDASDFATVVEVSTADRIGLLFDLARTFHDLELDVHVAKVATYGPRVVDAFYVRDLFGRKVEDPEHVREIERAVSARLAHPG